MWGFLDGGGAKQPFGGGCRIVPGEGNSSWIHRLEEQAGFFWVTPGEDQIMLTTHPFV